MMQVTHRSFVNAWQCDENDHLNVKFYTGFADQAAPQLDLLLDAPADQGVAVVRDYVRYHREMRTADSVEVRSAPLSVDRERMTALHEIRNADDREIACTVVRTTAARDAEGRPTVWDEGFRRRAEAAVVALPDMARARTITRTAALPAVPPMTGDTPGLVEIGRGAVLAAESDALGRMTPQSHFGRFSDGAGFLWRALGFDRPGMRERNQGTVVVETMCLYAQPARAGDLLVLRSGLLACTGRVMHFGHFLMDARDGGLLAYSEGVGVLFDLGARKIVKLDGEVERLQGMRLKV